MSSALVRELRPDDGPRVAEIVRTVFSEYRIGFDLAGYDKDLTELERRYGPPGAFFVLEDPPGAVAGSIGATDEGARGIEIHRLYLDPRVRGRGHGRRLLRHALAWCRERGARRVFLWSDVRFPHAHALYESEGFTRSGQRVCEDLDRSVEYGFERDLS